MLLLLYYLVSVALSHKQPQKQHTEKEPKHLLDKQTKFSQQGHISTYANVQAEDITRRGQCSLKPQVYSD